MIPTDNLPSPLKPIPILRETAVLIATPTATATSILTPISMPTAISIIHTEKIEPEDNNKDNNKDNKEEFNQQKFLNDIQISQLSIDDKNTVDNFLKLIFTINDKKEPNAQNNNIVYLSSPLRIFQRLLETASVYNSNLLLPVASAFVHENKNDKHLNIVIEKDVYQHAMKLAHKTEVKSGIRQFLTNRSQNFTPKDLLQLIKIFPFAKEQDDYAIWLMDIINNPQNSNLVLKRSNIAAEEFKEIVSEWRFSLMKHPYSKDKDWHECHTKILISWLNINKNVFRHGMSRNSTKIQNNSISWIESFVKLYELCPGTEWIKILRVARIDFFYLVKKSLFSPLSRDLVGDLVLQGFLLKDFSDIEKDAMGNRLLFYFQSSSSSYSFPWRSHASNIFSCDLFLHADNFMKETKDEKNSDLFKIRFNAIQQVLGISMELSEERLYAFLRIYIAFNKASFDVDSSVILNAQNLLKKMISYMDFAISEEAKKLGLFSFISINGGLRNLILENWHKKNSELANLYLYHLAIDDFNVNTKKREKI